MYLISNLMQGYNKNDPFDDKVIISVKKSKSWKNVALNIVKKFF